MKASATATALLLFGLSLAIGACEGPAGASCTVTTDMTAGTSTIRCTDGTMAVIRGGSGMDGTSCTVTHDTTAGTATIMCDDGTMATVADGAAATCEVATDTTTGVSTITCSDGSMATVANGDPGLSCSVAPAGPGMSTITCDDGTTVTVANGAPGPDGLDVRVASHHGEDYLLTIGEYAGGAKTLVTAEITAATADAAGLVTVDFSVETRDATPVPVTDLAAASATIAKLVPAATGEASNHWVPYIWRTETVSGSATGDWPNPDGTTGLQGNSESSGTMAGTGTLTNNHDGTYRYVFATNLTSAMMGTTPITYDRTLTHRVVIMLGGHAGPTDDDTFDFRPDGMAVTATRNIIETSTCQQCHAENEFKGHGGNRLSLETCVVCHAPGTTDAQSGNSLDMMVMTHRIHAGGEMAPIPGPDGILWDDPATAVNEQADNVDYSIWGYRNARHTWWKVGFPAVLDNCQMCHKGAGENVDNWQQRPSRAACGACHADVNFVTGAGHPSPGGIRTDDGGCTACHTESTIEEAHDFVTNDPRNIPEFTADITFSTQSSAGVVTAGLPTRGYYIDGERPVLNIALHDGATLIAGTSIVEDPAAEGCTLPGPCPTRDGLFRSFSMFVSGPRARQTPVLTNNARAQVRSATTGPWDLSAAGANLQLILDQGVSVHGADSVGGDVSFAGTVTVAVPAAGGTVIPVLTAATTDQVVAWLNGNTNFARRAVATNEGGLVVLRSRNLGAFHALQLQASAVTTAMFGGDVTVHVPGTWAGGSGSTVSNDLRSRTTVANNDPKAVRTAAGITYTLDPVDDLAPGTYVVNLEITDAGNISSANYRTPTTMRVGFQVGTATAELPPARNCNRCHESTPGRGYVLDYLRHHKLFNDTAPDQCAACHDQQAQNVTSSGWSGAVAISRRVHAVHNGSALHYPNLTVSHSDGIPGRNWDITLPMNVRNCEVCHVEGTTSGTWATRAARLPCGGCHDSDAATAHLRIMTFDPTPATPFSGDEEESCQTCH